MYLAIDIGGTKTLLTLFSSVGRRLKSFKFPTDQNPDLFIYYLGDHLSSFLVAENPRRIRAVVIAFPGIIEHGRPVHAPNLPAWNENFDFAAEFLNCTKNLFRNNREKPRIFYQNDGDLGAYYECHRFRGKTAYLTFGTGIGGGLIKDGKILQRSVDFEPGHRLYPFEDKVQEWEDFASSKAIRAANLDRDVTKIHDRASLKDIAIRLSPGIADIIREEHPDRIVLSGPLAEIFPYFHPYLHKYLRARLDGTRIPPLRQARHPQESVVYGAYLYAKAHAKHRSDQGPESSVASHKSRHKGPNA